MSLSDTILIFHFFGLLKHKNGRRIKLEIQAN